MTSVDKLGLLLNAFVELNRLRAEPGEKSHAIWLSTDRVWRLILEIARKP